MGAAALGGVAAARPPAAGVRPVAARSGRARFGSRPLGAGAGSWPGNADRESPRACSRPGAAPPAPRRTADGDRIERERRLKVHHRPPVVVGFETGQPALVERLRLGPHGTDHQGGRVGFESRGWLTRAGAVRQRSRKRDQDGRERERVGAAHRHGGSGESESQARSRLQGWPAGRRARACWCGRGRELWEGGRGRGRTRRQGGLARQRGNRRRWWRHERRRAFGSARDEARPSLGFRHPTRDHPTGNCRQSQERARGDGPSPRHPSPSFRLRSDVDVGGGAIGRIRRRRRCGSRGQMVAERFPSCSAARQAAISVAKAAA